MCYRKSFVEGSSDQIQTGTCPSCGMPVAAPIGVTSGICPHCNQPIPKDPPADGPADADKKKIL